MDSAVKDYPLSKAISDLVSEGCTVDCSAVSQNGYAILWHDRLGYSVTKCTRTRLAIGGLKQNFDEAALELMQELKSQLF